MICGGKRKNVINKDDYVIAAVMIYLDIINIFLYILQILATSKD
jgi:FtsH-binding integral membrane protein